MHAKHRGVALLVLLLVVSILAVSCAPPTAAPTPTVPPAATVLTATPTAVPTEVPLEKAVVRMWGFPLTDDDMTKIWDPLLEKFHAANPDITVKVEMLPWADRRPAMLTAFAAGENPDCAYFNIDMVPEFGAKGVMEPLQDKVPEEVLNDYPEDIIKGFSYGGNLTMLPLQGEPWHSVYNKDVFREIGWDPEDPPDTWDEMREFCAQAKAKDFFCWGTSPNGVDLMILTWQAGGHTLNEDGTASAINSPAGLEALNFILEMYKNGWVPEEDATYYDPSAPYEGTREYFANGKQAIACAMDSSALLIWRDQVPGIDLGTMPCPEYKRRACYAGAGAFGIFSNSKVKEAALKWILFLVEPENMLFIEDKAGYMPMRQSAVEMWSEMVDDKALTDFANIMLYADASRDSFAFFIEQYTIMKEEVQAAILEQKTAEQALADIEKRVNEAIAEASTE